MLKLFLPLLLLAMLAGCATAPLPQRSVPGAAIETLQGSVNISLSSPAGQVSGNGVLFYRRPGSFRLSLLAPFGQILFDIVVSGERVLCLKADSKKGWQGDVGDLPDSLGQKVWPLMDWAVEPPLPSGPARERVFSRPDGTAERVYYDSAGLVVRKVNSSGDEVSYSDYRLIDNLSFANRLEVTTAEGSRLTLTFDEPELNRPLDSEIFTPDLAGYEILPLAGFKGF